jgi:hypothetical protein
VAVLLTVHVGKDQVEDQEAYDDEIVVAEHVGRQSQVAVVQRKG